jgi:hypothetical protein
MGDERGSGTAGKNYAFAVSPYASRLTLYGGEIGFVMSFNVASRWNTNPQTSKPEGWSSSGSAPRRENMPATASLGDLKAAQKDLLEAKNLDELKAAFKSWKGEEANKNREARHVDLWAGVTAKGEKWAGPSAGIIG